MVDTRDLKSLAGNRVPVRVRSPAPERAGACPLLFLVPVALSASLNLMGGGAAPPPKPSPKDGKKSSVLRGSSFPNRPRFAELRFGYPERFGYGLPQCTRKSRGLSPALSGAGDSIRFAQFDGRGRSAPSQALPKGKVKEGHSLGCPSFIFIPPRSGRRSPPRRRRAGRGRGRCARR